MRQSHAPQHVRGLGELDDIIADNLYAIAPRVEEIEKRAGQWLDTRVAQRFADCVLIVDHQSKMAALISGLGTALLQWD